MGCQAHLVGGFDDLVDRKKKFSMFASSGITEPFVMKDDLSSRNIHDPESVMCSCKRVLMDSGLFLPSLAFQSRLLKGIELGQGVWVLQESADVAVRTQKSQKGTHGPLQGGSLRNCSPHLAISICRLSAFFNTIPLLDQMALRIPLHTVLW